MLGSVVACSNPELDAAKKGLALSVADRNHYKVIEYADMVLSHDAEDIEALTQLRNSSRIYAKLNKLAEKMSGLNVESSFESSATSTENIEALVDGSPELKNKAIELCKLYLVEAIAQWSDEESCSKDETIGRFNAWFTSTEGGPLKKEAVEKIARLATYSSYSATIEELKAKVNDLEEAQALLDEAERLDDKFRGLEDIQGLLDELASTLTLQAHQKIFLVYPKGAEIAYAYQNKLATETEAIYDQYGQYGVSISRALEMAELEVEWKQNRHLPLMFDIFADQLRDLEAVYKDLDDTYEMDELEHALVAVQQMRRIYQLASSAEGSLRSWSSSTSDAVSGLGDAMAAFNSEVDYETHKANLKIEEKVATVIPDLSPILSKRADILSI